MNCTHREAVCRCRQVVLFLRNPKNTIKRYLNIFSAHFSLFRNVIYTVRQAHVTNYGVDFSNLSYSVIVSVFRTCYDTGDNVFARATWYASGLGFFAKRPPPWIAIVVKCSRLRTQETHKFGVPQIGDTQIRGFCSERLHAQETARHKRCFGSRGDAAHRGLLAAAGPWASRASPRRHPRAAGGGSLWQETGTCHTRRTATSW